MSMKPKVSNFVSVMLVAMLLLYTRGAGLPVGTGPIRAQDQTQQPEQKPKDLKEKQEPPRGRTAIRVNVEQVSIDVTVMDKDGNLIRGLAPEAFKVYEDKVEQKIANFT